MANTAKKDSVFCGLTRHHWLVVLIAAGGWTFDCMDARLFVLARESALKDLLAGHIADPSMIKTYLGYATTALILGWATGGILFGIMSDRVGRVKTMVATLLTYSMFTALSGAAVSWIDFTAYRFLMGLGVGGMFGAATTLVAETVPGGFRPLAGIYIVGAIALIWAPETKDKPLPEDSEETNVESVND